VLGTGTSKGERRVVHLGKRVEVGVAVAVVDWHGLSYDAGRFLVGLGDSCGGVGGDSSQGVRR
jgi:hypothetical protein